MATTFSLILSLGLLSMTLACYITNCPPGGKRSSPTLVQPKKMCSRCGPDGSGQCFGPEICCGASFGCKFRSLETLVCKTENFYPQPCKISGQRCGKRGHCAVSGICCTHDSCSMDERCELANETPDDWLQSIY